MRYAEKLLEFIDSCPSVYHAAKCISDRLDDAGFIRLFEGKKWSLEEGKDYYVVRNNSSVIAFRFLSELNGFNIVASHLDSPTFKIKENPEMKQGAYTSLNTEKYGGMIMSTWLDRPLSVAGRVFVREGNSVTQKLVNIDRDLLIIPNMAIHMDRTVNDGKKFNPQTDLLPLMTVSGEDIKLLDIISNELGIKSENIIGNDLFLYNRQKGTILGAENEFVCAPKLDDLQCAFGSLTGFIESEKNGNIPVLAVFDNEEVGSQTKQGAAATFLRDVIRRIVKCAGGDEEMRGIALTNSFMISADNAHSVHPNQMSVADPTNRPIINKGIVIKYNANQRYTTDGVSRSILVTMLDEIGAEHQTFHNRSDIAGGGTLGNISNTQVSLNTVDIGLPQLAMHSSYETAGVYDTEEFVRICRHFFACKLSKIGDDRYIVE